MPKKQLKEARICFEFLILLAVHDNELNNRVTNYTSGECVDSDKDDRKQILVTFLLIGNYILPPCALKKNQKAYVRYEHVGLYGPLQVSTNFFCKGPEGKHFSL